MGNVDAFSIGVVAYTVLCGYEPFYGVNERLLIAANKAGRYEFHMPEWEGVPDDAKDLVAALLERDPAKRLTPEAALSHPWLLRHAPYNDAADAGAGDGVAAVGQQGCAVA
eukprot:TRINITY_DN1824_c3_g1_i3.p4 TRINITY_DN1824_c3_g1~~TRINITY_DN1824_c3_g1_i3.p4  ORF type:complete len:111 (-),score=47.58 TRINITY_DN1824_c3_g1_i3:434-766(-)